MAGEIVSVEWDFEGVGTFTTGKQPIHIGGCITARSEPGAKPSGLTNISCDL
jgi:hypothetical protein